MRADAGGTPTQSVSGSMTASGIDGDERHFNGPLHVSRSRSVEQRLEWRQETVKDPRPFQDVPVDEIDAWLIALIRHEIRAALREAAHEIDRYSEHVLLSKVARGLKDAQWYDSKPARRD